MSNLSSIGKILPKSEIQKSKLLKVFWKVFNSEKWEIKIEKNHRISIHLGFQRCSQKYRRIIKYF